MEVCELEVIEKVKCVKDECEEGCVVNFGGGREIWCKDSECEVKVLYVAYCRKLKKWVVVAGEPLER